MGGVTIVYAFDPIDELDDRSGILVLPAELAGRLIAEHRVERVDEKASSQMRFVPGSKAFAEARLALRAARDDKPSTAPRARKVAKLER